MGNLIETGAFGFSQFDFILDGSHVWALPRSKIIPKYGCLLIFSQIYLETVLVGQPMLVATAVAALDDVFVDFPFACDADRTTLFAAIITQVCRRSYAIAPMFMFDKPKSGTGATLLSQLVSLVTTGKMPKRITYSTETLEFEKRATATLRQNNGVVPWTTSTATSPAA